MPRFTRAPGYPFGPSREDYLREVDEDMQSWGTVEGARRWQVPGRTEEDIAAAAAWMRQGASPGAARALELMNAEIDVRGVLDTVRVPTLVLHRTDDHLPIEAARWMAERIPGAQFRELPGGPHNPVLGDWECVVNDIEAFAVPICTAPEPAPDAEPDLVLATVLFTDIVGSTAKATELGDRAWRELLSEHHELTRRQLQYFRGHEIDTAGDGFFASFDGPARARSGAPARSPSR
jgi:class 3 adenylate cyclase